MSDTAPRAQPFYCPFCGEEDFVPSGDGPAKESEGESDGESEGAREGASEGEYHCRSCDRRFTVRYLGLGPSPKDAPAWRSDTR